MKSHEIRILIVDDHPLLLSGLCLLLNAEQDLQVVGRAEAALPACALAQQLQPDVILLDISLPDVSGLEILPELRRVAPQARIIMLTMHDDRQYLREALDKGARGFLPKQGLDIDLLYAVRAVQRGELFIHPKMMQELLQPAGQEAISPEEQLWRLLSQREQQVVLGVIRGFTGKQIGEQLCLSEKTIATYRSRAMIKLGVETRAELVELLERLRPLP
ncbi:MAG: hypothetical protein BWK76_11240 [Desulfobulbaceae bacterium A2]|nr:MAG: hypothetical protein BWK76_11240 [Desulfobulbaceae bacterium A2]